jgi:hypothetical protein
MKLGKLIHDPKTCGETQASLKMLRDAIANRFRNRIAVLQLDTTGLTCGFLVLDLDEKWDDGGTGVWSGDGFRSDRVGEGGAAYRTAEVIFLLFGIDLIYFDYVDILEYTKLLFLKKDQEAGKLLLNTMSQIAVDIEDSDFVRPVDLSPAYIS